MPQPALPSYLADPLAQPGECATCRSQPCRNGPPGTLDICQYGIAFYNDNGQIKKRKESVTLRHIAANLRHELDKVLQYLINQAVEIDDSISLKQIDLTKPASRIVGATVILDNFIEMISGVYDFAPNRDPESASIYPPLALRGIVQRYSDIYSLIKNTRRASNLDIQLHIDPDYEVPVLGPVVEYLVAILADNIWKYAPSGSKVEIACSLVDAHVLDLQFHNDGAPLPAGRKIFERGYKLDHRTEGFGFGLYWATILCDHFNTVTQRSTQPLSVDHFESSSGSGLARHTFSIRNLPYQRRK